MSNSEAHVRIDEGIKRGPRKPQNKLRRSPKADLGAWVIPADLDPNVVLDRYLTEATTSQIAAQYGLSRKALVRWLRATKPKEWKDIQLIRAHVHLEDGEEGIDRAEDESSAISLACARERIKAAQFRLQAIDPDYQPKQQVTVTNVVHIDHALEGRASALLDRLDVRQVIDVTPSVASHHEPQVIDVASDAAQQTKTSSE